TLSGISGDGTLAIGIGPGTASDSAGNLAPAVPSSTSFTVDNTPPTISVSAPSSTITNTGPVTYTVSYTGASNVTLSDAQISLTRTGTADAAVSVSGSGNATRTVTLCSTTGNGTLGIVIFAGSATDSVGNPASSASSAVVVNVD